MCLGPSAAEKRAAAEQRAAAEETKRQAIDERANQKREDIEGALSARVERKGKRGGAGRRSLFTSSGGASGFTGRFS